MHGVTKHRWSSSWSLQRLVNQELKGFWEPLQVHKMVEVDCLQVAPGIFLNWFSKFKPKIELVQCSRPDDYNSKVGLELGNQSKVRRNQNSTTLGTSKDPSSFTRIASYVWMALSSKIARGVQNRSTSSNIHIYTTIQIPYKTPKDRHTRIGLQQSRSRSRSCLVMSLLPLPNRNSETLECETSELLLSKMMPLAYQILVEVATDTKTTVVRSRCECWAGEVFSLGPTNERPGFPHQPSNNWWVGVQLVGA